MARRVTFLHLADLHVGLRVARFDDSIASKLKEARFQALDNALALAGQNNVDFIVIAGDLFDDNAADLVDVQRAFDMLRQRPCPVLVLPGNHDPLRPGSIWRRAPWRDWEGTSIVPLLERKPWAFEDRALVYPCPVTRKTSVEDPTAWIENEAGSDTIRIGVAHGSVQDRPGLPVDDHPLPLDCPDQRGLDYLALGHWHSAKKYQAGGCVRMAYPGTAERIGFGGRTSAEIGWSAYAADPERPELRGDQAGAGLLVRIDKDGADSAVQVKDLVVGQLIWKKIVHDDIDDQTLELRTSELARLDSPERTMLRVELSGLVSAEKMIALEGLTQMLERRFLFSELHLEGLHARPDQAELAEALGPGILGQMGRNIEQAARQAPPEQAAILEDALLTLYRIARESGS